MENSYSVHLIIAALCLSVLTAQPALARQDDSVPRATSKAVVLPALSDAPQATATAVANQTGLSLQIAVSEGEANSPDLKRLKSVTEKYSWDKTSAMSGFLPHLTASYDHFLNSDYMSETIEFGGKALGFPAAYPQDNLLLDASITIFDGFDSYHKYKSAVLRSESAELDLSRAKFQIQNTVPIAFYQALAAQKLLDVAKQNVMTLQKHLDRAKLTARTGYGTRFDVLRIEATLQEAADDQELAENNVVNMREALQVAMGVEGSDTRVLNGELPILRNEDVPANLEFSINDREDVRAQNKRVDSLQQDIQSTSSFQYPTISIFAEENFYKFGTFNNLVQPNSSFQSASSVGLRLKWNLFDGGTSYARHQQAASEEYEQRQYTQKALVTIPKEVAKWKRQFYYSVSLYNARLKSVSEYEESVRLAGIGVKAGSNTHTEMLDAELDLFRARAGLVKAQAQMIDSFQNVEVVIGKRLQARL